MDHTTRRCRACYAALHFEPAWKTLCKSCFAAAKKREVQQLQDEVAELRMRLAAASRPESAIEPTMIRTLLQLCHPDKHGDSPMATRATQYLLSLKREHAEAAR